MDTTTNMKCDNGQCEKETTDAGASGRVKWFNSKAGYGFITVNDCESNDERDIFVHHTDIQVDQSQYKYLVQGEYVMFDIRPTDKANHSINAVNVKGMNGGKLMCETRNETRARRTETQQPKQRSQTQSTERKSFHRPRVNDNQREQPPRLDQADQSEWMVVRRRANTVSSGSSSGNIQHDTKPRQARPPRQRQPEIEMS